MATAEILADLSRATDENSSPEAGAKWYFYATGTTTPQPVYTSAALTTPHANPVVADAGGQFPAIYFDATKQYRGVLKTAGGVTLRDIDPINPGVMAFLAAPGGSSVIGFLQDGDGAVARTLEDKLRETVSILDFGGVGDGVTDNSGALLAALLTGKPVFFPVGDYAVADNFDFGVIKAQTSVEVPIVMLYGEGRRRSRILFTGAGTFLKGGTSVPASNGYLQSFIMRDLSLVGDGVKGNSLAVPFGQFVTTAGNGFAGCDSTQTAIEWEFDSASSVRNSEIECFGTGVKTKQGYGYTIAESHIQYNMIGLAIQGATTTANIVGNVIERNGIGIGLWITTLIHIGQNAIQGNYAGADIVSYSWNSLISIRSNYFEASPHVFVQNSDAGGPFTPNNIVFVENKGLGVELVDFANRFFFIRNRVTTFDLTTSNVSQIVVEDNTTNDGDGLVPFTSYTGTGASAVIYRDMPAKVVQPYTAAASVANGLSDGFNILVPGAEPGNAVTVTHSGLPAGWETAGNCTSSGVVRVDLRNFTGSTGGSFTGALTVLARRI